MNTKSDIVLVIAVMAAITFCLRALPFVAARLLTRYPMIRALGQFLPPAIMTLLLLHTLTGLAGQTGGHWWPEILATGLVFLVHWHWAQPLLSILAGITCYILLVP